MRPDVAYAGVVAVSGVGATAVVAGAFLSAAMAAPARAQDGARRPLLVVTTEILGSVIAELAAGEADVVVLIDGGVDPHAWAPSARDTESIMGADLVVANGLGLEEGLVEVLARAGSEGVRVFEATDHIAVRELAGEHGHEDEEGHDDADGDPHFWLDPLAMRDVVAAVTTELEAVGVEASARGGDLEARLEALDSEVSALVATIPAERRRIVTGHQSMGYFAERYGFELVGTVIPGSSSQGQASAGQLADLIDDVHAAAVAAVFTEVGTPTAIADAVAAETGARIVELALEQLPADGSYETLIRTVATTLATALEG